VNKKKIAAITSIVVLSVALVCASVLHIPLVATLVLHSCKANVTQGMLDALDLDGINNIMLVAHPDDETLFGGAEILGGGYLVVSITNQNVGYRHNEFSMAMRYAGARYLILDHRDGYGLSALCQKAIRQDVMTLLQYKEWDKIVTHCPRGTYGHRDHVVTHNAVKSMVDELEIIDNLYYFDYFEPHEIHDHTPTIDEATIERIHNMLALYSTQTRIINRFIHHVPFQGITKATDWV
jgi:hypothetical protein